MAVSPRRRASPCSLHRPYSRSPVIVYLLAPEMSTLGGLEGQLAALATGLTQRGHRVYVFVRDPVRRQHPYRRRMESAGVRFSVPRPRLAVSLNPVCRDRPSAAAFRAPASRS
jgi:hypothetical protein